MISTLYSLKEITVVINTVVNKLRDYWA